MTKLNRLSSVFGAAVKSKPKPQTLPSPNTRSRSPKHKLQETSSLAFTGLIDTFNSKNNALVNSLFSILSSTNSSHPNSSDGSLYAAPSLEEIDDSENVFEHFQSVPWISHFAHKAVGQRRKETSRLRREKWISNSSSGDSFEQLVNKCGQNFGTGASVDLIFTKLGRQAAAKDCTVFIRVCLENARKSNDGDFVVEQISVIYKILQFMKDNGFPLDEGTYRPILLYFIDMTMEEEFHLFLDFIKDKYDLALPSLGYYEMLLYIKANREEKIQELCNYTSTNDTGETVKLRENYLLALCDSDRKSELLQLFEVIDVTKVSANNLANIFESLGRLSLESYAKRFLSTFKDHDYGADTISNLIFNYAISAPNLAVRNLSYAVGAGNVLDARMHEEYHLHMPFVEDVVSKFKNLHLLLEMEPHLESYEKMVVYCCEVHEVHVALDVIHQMCEEGLTVSEGTLNSLLRSIENNLEFYLVRRIYSLIREKDLNPTCDSFKMLISFCVKMKEFDTAYAMLDDLKKFNLVPNASMYNVIMAGYFREKNPCAARKVFKQMKLAGVQPDSQTYSYLISNCNCEKKIRVYNEEMEHAKIVMTKYTFMALISAYTSCGQFGKAKQVLWDDRIESSDLNDIRSVLVYALASHGQLCDALSIYEEMKEARLDVTPRAVLSLIEYCRSELDLNGLLKLLEEVRNSEYWTSCCSRILSYCFQHKHLSPAIDLIKQLEDKFQDNELAMEVLFDEMFAKFAEMESPDLQFAMSLLEGIEKEISFSPSRKCLDFLLTASIKAKDLRHSRLIWKKYKQMGLPYNVMNYLGMYQALLACGEHQSANKMLSKIPTGDPDVRAIIEACQRTYPEKSTPQKSEEIKKKRKKKKKAVG